MRIPILLFFLLSINSISHSQDLARDISFNDDHFTANTTVRAIAVQGDNSIVIAGDFDQYDGSYLPAHGMVARLLPNGQIDGSFTSPNIQGGIIRAMAVQPWDGKIIIGGGFTSVDGVPRSHIARLEVDGQLDTSFDPGTGFQDLDMTYSGGDGEGDVYSILIQDHSIPTKRRIYIGGAFETYNGFQTGTLVKVNEWGARDATYNPQVNHGAVFSMCLDPLNRLIIGGEFWYIGSSFSLRVARITTTGANDGSFSHGWVNNSVSVVQIDNHGMVMLARKFTSIGSTTCNGIARLQTNGTPDPAFNTGSGISGGITSGGYSGPEISTILVRSDDIIFAGGNFNSFNGSACGNIVPINDNGSMNTYVDFKAGFNYPVKSIMQQVFGSTDIRYLVGAYDQSLTNQSKYRGVRQGNIIRLIPTFDVLPTRIINNKAAREKNNVRLTWKTATQEKTETIRIKRSFDGINFVTIRNLKQEQALQQDKSFLFIDQNVPDGDLFYKIQFLHDSTVKLESNNMMVRSVSTMGEELKATSVTGGNIMIESRFIKKEQCSIKIYGMDGKMLKETNAIIPAGISNQTILLPEMNSKESFILSIYRPSDHRNFTFKLMK